MVNDAHCHFFSPRFFAALATQRGRSESGSDLCRVLQWDDPATPELLATRWVRELEAHGVTRAAVIASVPGDEASVATAVAQAPDRLVGLFMVDPAAPDAVDRVRRATGEQGLRGVCLFPAMSRVPLDDPRSDAVVRAAADQPGAVVFVHCGLLSVGVRKALGLPSPFDHRLGDPLAVARLAAMCPSVPFVIPHFGGGLFREALMAADACANIHFDTSSSNGWIRYIRAHPGGGVPHRARGGGSVSIAVRDRLLLFPRGWQRHVFDAQRAALDAMGVSEEARALVLGGNFDRLFPLPSSGRSHYNRRPEVP